MALEVVFNILPEFIEQASERVQSVLNVGAASLAVHAVEHMGHYPPASAPGDAPAKRTGEYAAAIAAHPDAGPLEATVSFPGVPGLFLEFGTVHMAKRPHIIPAVEVTTPEVEALLPTVFDV